MARTETEQLAAQAATTGELEVRPDEATTISTSAGDKPPTLPVGRVAIAAGLATCAAAVMVGGVYNGVATPRIWAAIAGILGVFAVTRIRLIKNPWLMNLVILLSVVVIGVILTVPGGSIGDVLNPLPFVREAITSGDVQRPPVDFTLGWRAILGWLMGGLGIASAWIGIELKRPALGVLLPLPVVAIAAISVPEDAKLASGILALLLFAVSLAMLSGVDMSGEGENRSLAYEMRRAARALPLLAIVTVLLVVLARANILFPAPIYDPSQSAQKPKAVPLTAVPDRVLFTVQSSVSGPWRMGSLDVYDGKSWRLPPFAENRIRPVPQSGVVDSELKPGVKATFNVEGLTGAVLPGLPNLVGLVAEGPVLAYDSRTGVIRLSSGSITSGLQYTVTAARIPSVNELQKITDQPPKDIEGVPAKRFLEISKPPVGIVEEIGKAPKTSKWAEFDYLRNKLLDTVVAKGNGTPVDVLPAKVDDMFHGTKQGSPFEIVAGQAMLARWVGIPSRIGYGFDGGDRTGTSYSVRPKHGATFVEVYFPGWKWLPIIGTPRQATTDIGNQASQRPQQIGASNDVAVQLFVPYETDPQNYLFQQFRTVLGIVFPFIIILLILYFIYPAGFKYLRRARRRSRARKATPEGRIALAYAEWRDTCTDFGYLHASDTPLMFLSRVVPDEEHTELAWLVTRTMWGDLRNELTEDDAAVAEELSRALRKRLGQAHTVTLRGIAIFSRLSVRHPYAPHLDLVDVQRRPEAAIA